MSHRLTFRWDLPPGIILTAEAASRLIGQTTPMPVRTRHGVESVDAVVVMAECDDGAVMLTVELAGDPAEVVDRITVSQDVGGHYPVFKKITLDLMGDGSVRWRHPE